VVRLVNPEELLMLFAAPARVVVLRLTVMALTLCLGVGVSLAQTTTSSLNTRAVGGISIDAHGSLQNATLDATGELQRLRAERLQPVPGELKQAVALRKVSLRGLEAALVKTLAAGEPLADEMRYLAGLQQIQYVLVYPEQHDVVLVGPGEGWKVDSRGNLIGLGSNRPVMLLDDLLVALRTARQAAQGGISCSIDPTPEGLQRLRAYVSKLHTIGEPQTTVANICETLGPQKITLQNVPGTTHFARVMVAADYRMKRLAMGFEPAPIRGLPSYMNMVSAGRAGMNNLLPRWWLAPHYAPLLKSPDGLAWELRGAAVKALAEEDFLAANGTREHTGKANPMAQRWANQMTAHFEELSRAEPIFGQLRNCMELAIVAALITKEQMLERAGCNLPVMMDSGRVELDQFAAPEQVATQASVVRKGRNWVISASGGVQIHSWGVAEKTQLADAPAEVRAQAAPKGDAWWWN
jgi:hypothetical protein